MSEPPADELPPALLPRGLRFVLLAHPTVQLVRFLAKAGLVWFLALEDLGEAAFAGLFVFAAAQLAILGLDEALIHAPRLDAPLWRGLVARQRVSGLVVAALLAAAGFALGGVGDHPLFGSLLATLAPVIWIGNLSVLPAALLARERAYKSIFLLDLAQVAALTLGTWISAALGLGPFSLVVGWYANALAALFVARLLAAPFVPHGAQGAASGGPRAEPGGGDELPRTLRFGRQLTGASLLSYAVERGDSLAVGAALGRAALGLYDFAQHLATAVQGYAANLVERFVFPTLAGEHRAGRHARVLEEALRFVLLVVVPLHVLLARVGRQLVQGIFPGDWTAAAPLIGPLALAAGARTLELFCVASLKATGQGGTVLWLSWVRVALLAVALGAALPHGLAALALAVCLSRAASACASLVLCLLRRPSAAGAARETLEPVLWAGLLSLVWSGLVVAVGELAQRALGLAPLVYVALVVGFAAAVWFALRRAFDHDALRREQAWLAARLARAWERQPDGSAAP